MGRETRSKSPLTGVSIVYTLNRRHEQIWFWHIEKGLQSKVSVVNLLLLTQLIIHDYPVIISYRCSTTVFLEINFAGLTFAPRSKKPYWLANSRCVVMISAGRRMVAETLWNFQKTGYFSSYFHFLSNFVGRKSWSKFGCAGVSMV